MSKQEITAIRGPALTFTGDAFAKGVDETLVYEPDAIVVMSDGKITHFGPASTILKTLPVDLAVKNFGKDALIMPGFIDTHVHYPQTQIIGAYGEQLIDWLHKYAFAAEQQFSDKAHAKEVAKVFLQECLRAGTTTASVYCTVHPQSVDAFFEEADALNMRMIAGKVMMDRNAPAALTDTPQQSFDDSQQLIDRWHNNGRQLYSITPRFAPTSSPEQLMMARALWQQNPGTYLQSHLAENKTELDWVKELYPDNSSYLDVYDHFQLLGPRAIFGHGIWLTEAELQRCHESGTSIAHCPTSNNFLGGGLFNLANTKKVARPVKVGLGTDIGAGTSFSMLQTLNETYKVAQLGGNPLSAELAFYLATRGSAEALYLEEKIGSIAPGMEADLVVLDLKSTPLIDYRMKFCDSLAEALFIQITLGDDRAVQSTYSAGKCLYNRDS